MVGGRQHTCHRCAGEDREPDLEDMTCVRGWRDDNNICNE